MARFSGGSGGGEGTVGPAGPTGPTGATGATGSAGAGVAAGGTAGQTLSKVDGTDYNTVWADPKASSTYYLVRNNTGSTIPKGTLVSAIGAEPSGRIDVEPFAAIGGENSELRVMGMAIASIATGVNGEVMSFGTLTGLDTRGTSASALAVGDETWAAGDILFAHPTVAGKLTNVRPQHDLAVAFITVRHASAGQIAIRIVPGNNHLEWMHDVEIDTPADNEVLAYDSASGVWKNQTPLDIGLVGPEPSINYSSTLTVDPNGDDTNGTGGPNDPFQTIQKAHDYAVANIDPAERVVVKINAGEYIENLTVTRSRTNFVGLTNGHSRSNTLRGNVNVQISNLTDTANTTTVAFENLLIVPVDGDNSDVFTVSGNIPCNIFLKDLQLFTWSTTAKCLFVNTSAPAGISVHVNNVLFQNELSSGATLDFSNTKYANLDGLFVFSGSGVCLDIKTTQAVVYNARFEKSGTSAAINATSGFGALPSLVLGNATISNSNADGVGIDIANSTVNIGQTTFNVGTAAGTGFAVKGVSGAVFVNGNNLIVPGTNNKISTAITRVALGTSLTPA
jgi:hypothetical protein